MLLSAHQSIGAPQPLLYFGSDEQKEYWLPKLCTQLSAFALTEPGVGSDPAKMTCAAVPTEDGSGYRITGQKLWTTNGTIAEIFVVLAKVPRSEGHKGGITAFVVPRDAGNIITDSRNEFMGIRGIENSLTRYDGVFVPKENVIGREGAGLKIALTTLNTGRMGIPAQCAATAKWSAKVAREFAAARIQWGKPIGQHDEVAQRVGFIAATAFGLEAVVDVTSRLADEKRNDVRIEAALAKLYTTELGWLVSDGLMQVCGGRGYETAASLKARDFAASRSSKPCGTCAVTASPRAPPRSCTCSSPGRRWISTSPWPGISSRKASRSRGRGRPSRRRAGSTASGTRS